MSKSAMLSDSVYGYEKRIAELEALIVVSKGDRSDLYWKNKNLERELAEVKVERDGWKDMYNQRVSDAERDYIAARAELAEVKQQNERLHQLNMRVDDERSAMKRELAEVKSDLKYADRFGAQNNELSRDNRELRKELAEVKKAISELGLQYAETDQALVDRLVEVANLKTENERLVKMVAEYGEAIERATVQSMERATEIAESHRITATGISISEAIRAEIKD